MPLPITTSSSLNPEDAAEDSFPVMMREEEEEERSSPSWHDNEEESRHLPDIEAAPPPSVMDNHLENGDYNPNENTVAVTTLESATDSPPSVIVTAIVRETDVEEVASVVDCTDAIVYALTLDDDKENDDYGPTKPATVLEVLQGNDDQDTAVTMPYESNDSLPTIDGAPSRRLYRRTNNDDDDSHNKKRWVMIIFPLLLAVVICIAVSSFLLNSNSGDDDVSSSSSDGRGTILSPHYIRNTTTPASTTAPSVVEWEEHSLP